MLIPIGTDIRPRRPPVGNYLLIFLNVLVFLFTDVVGGAAGEQLKSVWTLYAAVPDLAQYVTYQFLHGDWVHLVGNMLFLWIFGNAVCDRMGSLCYAMFYLAGGVCAGLTFAQFNDNAILGASGSIAAVTTAFLVLFPRVHITMLVWLFVITAFQVPAVILIVFKIILWDNIVTPMLEHSAVSNVAHSAHLGGYAFGFCVALVLLAARALPRNPFDLLSLWNRWQRRAGLVPAAVVPRGRPVIVEEVDSRPLEPLSLTPTEQLRQAILVHLSERDVPPAADLYLKLIELDRTQVLPRPAQLDVGNYLAQTQRYRQAVAAYEAFLAAYPASPDASQVRLLLGLIQARYLGQLEPAAVHLRAALDSVTDPTQRDLAERELREIAARRARED